MLGGNGRFLADHAAGAQHVVFVRSTQAHAVITGVDATVAEQMPGVHGVFFAEDIGLAGAAIPSLTTPDADFTAATSLVLAEQRLTILASEVVHYVGQPIAVVVADDRYRGRGRRRKHRGGDTNPCPGHRPGSGAGPAEPVLFGHLHGNEAARLEYSFGDLEPPSPQRTASSKAPTGWRATAPYRSNARCASLF